MFHSLCSVVSQRKRSAHTRAAAFTLIELLVVVAIIALLISILLPALGNARDQAKRVKCAAQLHDIGTGLMTYNNDFGRFPHQNTSGAETLTNRADRTAHGIFAYAVHEYIADSMGGLRRDMKTGDLSMAHEVFYCPLVPENETQFSNVISGPDTEYGITDMEDQYLHIGYTYLGRFDECRNDPNLLRPSSGETEWEDVPLKRRNYAGRLPNSDDVLMADTVSLWMGGGKWRINHGAGWAEPYQFSVDFNLPPFDGANEMFADGHVEWKGRNHFPELINADTILDVKRNAMLIAGLDLVWW